MSNALDRLKARLEDIQNLDSAQALLGWEQQTYMPEGGAETRSRQFATLARLSHEMFTAEETGKLLDAADADLAGSDPDVDDASLLRVTRDDYQKATRVPSELVAEISRHSGLAHNVWAKARAENDYEAFAPYLSKTVELSVRLAEALGYEKRIYDALLDQYEPGTTSADVEAMFAELSRNLVPLVGAVKDHADRVSDAPLHQDFPVAQQSAVTLEVARAFGFDFERGRQDQAVHPFCQSLSPDDVRITTRFDPKFLSTALFGTMHETGHGLYEQGCSTRLHPRLATGTSLGVHESQSRMWENIVGRSRGFWQYYYGTLQKAFPEALGAVKMETFYRAINKSEPSLVRVEADELTYDLHIMVRFEMENELLEGKLKVAEAPEAWNAKYQSYLGIKPPTDSLGILQDVHWSGGMMGYFPTYSIGNLLSAQLFEQACADAPSIPADIAHGSFGTLLGWLREKVHVHGRKYQPQELVQRVTGKKLDVGAYLRYLRSKYGEIYGI